MTLLRLPLRRCESSWTRKLAFVSPKPLFFSETITVLSTSLGPALPTKLLTLRESAHDIQVSIEDEENAVMEVTSGKPIPLSLLPNWNPRKIETFYSRDKGRGIRAVRPLNEGEVIFVERPIASCESRDRQMTMVRLSNGSIDESSNTGIKAGLSHRDSRDGVLSKLIGHLYSGQERRPLPLVSFDRLFPRLHSSPLRLPGHHVYMNRAFGKGASTDEYISVDRIDGIVTKNAFGNGHHLMDASSSSSARLPQRRTSLLVAASMFNHAKYPNCTINCCDPDSRFWETGFLSLFRTIRPVAEGEELTICYHTDEQALARTWGISNSQD